MVKGTTVVRAFGACLMAIAMLSCSQPASENPETLVLAGINVVPMDRERVLPNQDLVIAGGSIQAIGPSGEVDIPAGANVQDMAGRYVMPGLYDVHVHVDREDELLMYVANGVTTVLNLHGEPWHLDWREAIESGERFGPRMLTCGPPLRGPSSPAEAAKLIQEVVAAGYDCLKIRGEWEEETYNGVAVASSDADLLFMGHAPRNQPLDLVLASGQRIVHLEELLYTNAVLDGWIEAARAEGAPDVPSERELDGEIQRLAQAVADSGIWIVPTEIVIDNYLARSSQEGRDALVARPYLRFLDPVNRRTWAGAAARGHRRFQLQTDMQYRLLVALHDRNVPMALGTDANVSDLLNVMPGWSVHEELAILQANGFSPFEALSQATTGAAEYLGRSGEGTLALGGRADLLVLSGNPLESLEFVREPEAVIVRGDWLSRSELDKQLTQLEASFVDLEREIATLDEAWADGAEAVAVSYRAMANEASPELAKYVEGEINRRGYAMLGNDQSQDAIATFRVNTELFPGSANTFDSLAEAYLESGDQEGAISYYQMALEVDPEYQNAARMLAQIEAAPE